MSWKETVTAEAIVIISKIEESSTQSARIMETDQVLSTCQNNRLIMPPMSNNEVRSFESYDYFCLNKLKPPNMAIFLEIEKKDLKR